MITTTLNEIKAHKPCVDGWAKIWAAQGGFNADFDKPFPLADALDSNGFDDVMWALKRLPVDASLLRKYAVWCARQVQHLMKDERGLIALDVAWRYSEGLATNEELAIVRENTFAAYAPYGTNTTHILGTTSATKTSHSCKRRITTISSISIGRTNTSRTNCY